MISGMKEKDLMFVEFTISFAMLVKWSMKQPHRYPLQQAQQNGLITLTLTLPLNGAASILLALVVEKVVRERVRKATIYSHPSFPPFHSP